MKLFIAFLLASLLGAGCRLLDIPVPAPPRLVGALLVLATTLGYLATDRALQAKTPPAATQKRTDD